MRNTLTPQEIYAMADFGRQKFAPPKPVPTVEVTRKTLRDSLAHAFAGEGNARMPGAKHWRRADLALNTLAEYA